MKLMTVEGRKRLCLKPGEYELRIQKSSSLELILLADRPGTAWIKVVVEGSGAYANIRMYSISDDVSLEARLVVEKGLEDVDASISMVSLAGRNIVQKPELEVSSNRVKAAHSATILSFSNNQLFYLAARGLLRSRAINALKESISSMFESYNIEQGKGSRNHDEGR